MTLELSRTVAHGLRKNHVGMLSSLRIVPLKEVRILMATR